MTYTELWTSGGHIMGGSSSISMNTISAQISRRFAFAEDLILVYHLSEERLLLTLPDEDTARLIYNDGHPFITLSLWLHIRRWSRLLGSTGAPGLSAVAVEL